MEITIIDKSALTGEKMNYNSIIFKICPCKIDKSDNNLDLSTAIVTVVKGGAIKVLLDFKNVEFIDSRGIGIIINSAKHLRASKGDLVLINVAGRVSKIFDTLNLSRMLQVFETESEALHHLKFI